MESNIEKGTGIICWEQEEWILCPVCGSKTCNKVREDTILINDSLYCPKCRQETLIEAKNIHVTVIKEPDTLDADDRVIIGTS